MIDEIDEYEQEIIEFNKTNSKSLESFNNIANDLDSFYATNSEYLKQHIVDDELMCKSNEEASNLIKIAELDIQKLKDVFFDEKILIFEKNKDQIYKSILGI